MSVAGSSATAPRRAKQQRARRDAELCRFGRSCRRTWLGVVSLRREASTAERWPGSDDPMGVDGAPRPACRCRFGNSANVGSRDRGGSRRGARDTVGGSRHHADVGARAGLGSFRRHAGVERKIPSSAISVDGVGRGTADGAAGPAQQFVRFLSLRWNGCRGRAGDRLRALPSRSVPNAQRILAHRGS
jgi:hypothetical protein